MLATLAQQLTDVGWVIWDDFLLPPRVAELRMQAMTQWQAGAFHAAGIGRGSDFKVNSTIRSDQVQWLEPTTQSALGEYQAAIERLRVALNQALYLGLFEFEGHFAVYPPGAFYRRHVDNFRGTSARIITAILYLNADWRPDDGGQLRLYTQGDQPDSYIDILPYGGRLVVFRSELFWHEVLPARRERLSLTGWLRTRSGIL
ncbi:MAG: 2OG-Fe(II) oxygenase [Thiothrix sp.]